MLYPRQTRCWALAVAVSVCHTALSYAAARDAIPAKPGATAAQGDVHVAARAGWSVRVAPQLQPSLDENQHPSVGQWSGQLALSRDSTEMLRIEVYPNPKGLSVAQWVQQEWADQTAKLLLVPLLATTKRTPALQAVTPPSPQRHQQILTFLQLGPDLAHVVCHTGADSRVKQWCDGAIAQLAPRGSR